MRATLTVERLSKLGDGAAALEGRTVFVEGALPGERVVAEVDTSEKIWHGRLLEVLAPSAARRPPACPLAAQCGGCDWLHADEVLQRSAKQEIVLSALEHLGGIARVGLAVGEQAVSQRALGYRRRAVFHFSKKRLAFFGRHSHALVAIDLCPALVPALADLPPELSEALAGIAKDVHEVHVLAEGPQADPPPFSPSGVEGGPSTAPRDARGERKRVSFAVFLTGPAARRHAEACEAAVRSLSVAGAVLVPKEGSPRLFGKPILRALAPLTPEVPVYLRPDAFAQANAEANVALVAAVAQAAGAGPADRVLELYSGHGNLTFALAGTAREVVAVESSGTAVELAQRSAREGRVTNVRFVQGDVPKVCRGLVSEGQRFELVVADPPRSGASGLGEWAKRLGTRRVVYVACDPASLARDAAELLAAGFTPLGLRLIDMFPQTRHAEAVMTLEAR